VPKNYKGLGIHGLVSVEEHPTYYVFTIFSGEIVWLNDNGTLVRETAD